MMKKEGNQEVREKLKGNLGSPAVSSKGLNVMLSWVIVTAIVVGGISIVLIAGQPALQQASASVRLAEAERTLNELQDAILAVRSEGIGSTRIIKIPSGDWRSLPTSGQIEFAVATDLIEPGTHRITNDLAWIAGPEASCGQGAWNGQAAWVMENSYLKAYLQRLDTNQSLNTTKNILAMQSKITNVTIEPADSSILIDSDPASSAGNGFSEMRLGSQQASCRAHFFVDSPPFDYDIYYTLYSAADFLVAEVRNIA
jgi:hypothetical protein